jgi:hypothetical protein
MDYREVRGEPQFSHPIADLVKPYLEVYTRDPEGWSRNVRKIVDTELASLPEHLKGTPGAVLFRLADRKESTLSSHPLDVVAHVITSGEYPEIVGNEAEGQVQKRHALYIAAINESALAERVLADRLGGVHGAGPFTEKSIQRDREYIERFTKFKDSLFATAPANSLKEGNQPQNKELASPRDFLPIK